MKNRLIKISEKRISQHCFVLVMIMIIISSCEKEEIAISAHEKGDITTVSVELEPDYRYQVFYDLESNTEVSRTLKTEWDLGFEASTNGYHVILNSSKAMQAYNSGTTNFASVTTTPTIGWTWDEPNGSMDSTAIGEWADLSSGSLVSHNMVYVIDLGYNYLGTHLGYKKLVIEGLDANGYTIRYADLNGANESTFAITKDPTYNFSFFSFSDGGKMAIIEPPKEDWDLIFTQYTHVFYDDPEPSFYLVTGVLQNRNNTLANIDTIIGFPTFTYDDVAPLLLKKSSNSIGYTWKKYDYDAGSYTIYSDKNYVIQDEQGFYYKLHFIDFYNASGEKGTPTFEYQKL